MGFLASAKSRQHNAHSSLASISAFFGYVCRAHTGLCRLRIGLLSPLRQFGLWPRLGNMHGKLHERMSEYAEGQLFDPESRASRMCGLGTVLRTQRDALLWDSDVQGEISHYHVSAVIRALRNARCRADVAPLGATGP